MSYRQRSYARMLAVIGAAVVLAAHIVSCASPADSSDASPQPSVAESNVQVDDTTATQHPAHENLWKEMQFEIPETTWPTTTACIAEETKEADVIDAVEPNEDNTTEESVVFTLTDVDDLQANYDLLKRVIVSEAGNQGMQGMCAVAQVIYDRTYRSKHDWNQDEGLYGVLTMRNQFASPYPWDLDDFEPTVSEAIDAVFIHGDLVFDEIVTYFYNPKYSTETGIKFMQAQKYVDTIKDHEFRTGWDEND